MFYNTEYIKDPTSQYDIDAIQEHSKRILEEKALSH